MRILYFDIDSLRPDHLGCYGYDRPTSPNIDRVAAQGMRFDRYYCADSPCMPSRHNLVTGRFGINNGIVTHGGPGSRLRIRERQYGGVAPENQLLQRQLRENGMDTICFSNFSTRHCAVWFSMGWSEHHSPNLKTGSEEADEVNASVLPWLKRNAGRDDFFLWTNYWDPHRNYTLPREWFDRMRQLPCPVQWPDDEAIQSHQSLPGTFTPGRFFARPGGSPTPCMPDTVSNRDELEHMVSGYDAEVAYADHHLGQILDELERQGVLDETAIIISADHGEAMGEHGIYGDHVCADECIHRVPLIIKWPGVTQPGTTCNDLLYNVDLSATLCELTGSDPPDLYDGISFAGGLATGRCSSRDHLVWGHGLYTLQRAVRTDSHLLVRTYDDYGYEFEPVALYEINSDPYQTVNISADSPGLTDELIGRLDGWTEEQLRKPFSDPDPFEVVLQERRT